MGALDAPMGAKKDDSNWLNREDIVIPADLPQPTLWRILVMPVQPASRSKGTHGSSIALPAQTQDSDSHLNYIGKVVAMGPLAGRNDRYLNPEPDADGPFWLWDIGVGDWVAFGRYSGQRIEYQGVKFILVNDDEILAKVNGPDGFRAYI